MEEDDRGPHKDADRDDEWDQRPPELERNEPVDRGAHFLAGVVAVLDREVDDADDDHQRKERGDRHHAEIAVVYLGSEHEGLRGKE